MNLLLNAIQACKPGGRVAVEVESGDAVHLRVIDNGCGIPLEARKRIFEPFVSAARGRHRPGAVPLHQLRAPVGRRHPRGKRARRRLLFRYRAAAGVGRLAGIGLMSSRANILLVDDDAAFRHVMSFELRRLGHNVTAASTGEEAVRLSSEIEPEVVLLDLRLPGMDGLATLTAIRERNASIEVVMLTGHGSIDTAIESIRVGAFDYVVKPCPLDELQVRIERALERRALRQRANLLERGLTPPDLAGSFVGRSPEFTRLMHLIDRVAPGDSTVLIAGETGSGKERVAKLIHSRSPRRSKPFVVVDCAVLQESLMASELFGHERGAFTGAERSKPGLFEVANGGTIFLDEIGEVSPAIQTKLLRVLDTSAFRRVGRKRRSPRGRAGAGGHQSRAEFHGPAGPIPRGPVLPHEHDHAGSAAPAEPRRRYRAAGGAFRVRIE